MKKLYILTAVFALLTLSLNAQTTYYQKVTSQSDLTNGDYLIVETYSSTPRAFDGSKTTLDQRNNYISVSISDNKIASSETVDNATFTIDMTAGTIKSASGYYIGRTADSNGIHSSQTEQYTNTITVNSTTSAVDIVGSSGAVLRYNNSDEWFRYYKSTTYTNQKQVYLFKKITSATTAELTAPTNGSTVNVGTNTGSGVSKEITVSGSNLTADLTVSVNGTGFSVSHTTISAANANAGTNVTVTYNGTVENATGTLTISSSEVSTTVNLTATYNSGTTPSGEYETLALFDTTRYVAEVLPVYGYNHDCTQHNQMIYPASLLTNMTGMTIKSMTFYPGSYSDGWGTYSGINFRNGTVTFKLMEVNGSTGFDSSNPAFITGTMTPVATITMPSTANTTATEWLIEFDNDYEYNGGDLVIDVTTTTGNYGSTYFEVGTTASLNVAYPGYYNYTGSYNGSSAVDFVPRVTFTYESSMPKTDAPTITVGDPTATGVTVTATATDPTATVTLTIGDRTETGTGSVSITIDRGTADQNLTATATAQEDGKRVSDPATAAVFVPALPKTEMPTINVVTNADGSKTVTATGNGTVHLYVDGVEVSNPYTIMPSADGDQTVTVTATAQEAGKLISETATQTVTIPEAGRSPKPTITMTDNGDGTYTITVTGTGEIAVYINDAEHGSDPIATANNTFSFNVEEHSQAMSITVQATNKEEGLLISRTAEETFSIPAMTIGSDFKELDPQPANASAPIDMSKLMFVDRFSVDIPDDNSHPFQYDYTLEETQVRQRTSNTVEVYVEKTGSKGQGFYSLKQIDNDKDAKLVMDVENAAMDFNLSELSAPFFYTVEREEEADGESYWGWNAVLQRTSVGNYKQTHKYDTKGRLVYNYNDTIMPGPHVQLDLDTITGDYNDYKAYVPVVWTMGFDRVNYDENNPVHNSYGASVWTTGVATVQMDDNNKPIAQRQTNAFNSVNWVAEGGPASLYILDNVNATATMPTVNTLDYEPYMFRIFVKSANNKLRPYKVVPQGEGAHDGEHLEAGEGTTSGPLCVWSGYVNDPKNNQPAKLADGTTDNPNYNGVEITINEGDKENNVPTTIIFKKNKVNREDISTPWVEYDTIKNPETGEVIDIIETNRNATNAMFGALDEISNVNGGSINKNDLEIFVRFYYVVKGMADGWTPWNPIRAIANADDPAGYGTESPGSATNPATGVSEIQYLGEVVETIYYNVQGMMSDKPFDGVNIVVTRFGNGTTSVSKIVR